MKIIAKDINEPTRIAKYLAQNGVVSRRRAETLISENKVKIDNQLVSEPGFKIVAGQIIEIALENEAKAISLIINKPIGYVSAQAQNGEKPAIVLIKPENCIENIKSDFSHLKIPALGRLDKDSHGLLILSNDGVLAKNVISPETESEKEYIVKVNGHLNNEKIAKLRHGLTLDGRKLKPAKVKQIGENTLNFVLREGRNRQIRRMCAMLGLEVFDLQRIRIGQIKLGNLELGKWRRLTDAEIASFSRAKI